MAPLRILPVSALVVLAVVLGTSASAAPVPVRDASAHRQTPVAAKTSVVRVVAAGDIACPPGMTVTPTQCQQGATADLARSLNPSLVLPLGDTQYEQASLAEYRGSYAKS